MREVAHLAHVDGMLVVRKGDVVEEARLVQAWELLGLCERVNITALVDDPDPGPSAHTRYFPVKARPPRVLERALFVADDEVGDLPRVGIDPLDLAIQDASSARRALDRDVVLAAPAFRDALGPGANADA